jgi:hypothetical protein
MTDVVKYHDWIDETEHPVGLFHGMQVKIDDKRKVFVCWDDSSPDPSYKVLMFREIEDGRESRLEFNISPECIVAIFRLADKQGLSERLKESAK